MMADEQPDNAAESHYKAAPFAKEFDMRQAKVDAMPVEIAKWNRLKRRVDNLETKWPINWLIAGASGSASLAASALIAAVSLPTGPDTGISSTVKPALLIGVAGSALLALALIAMYFIEKRGRTEEGADIVDEMETDEAAWKQREASERD